MDVSDGDRGNAAPSLFQIMGQERPGGYDFARTTSLAPHRKCLAGHEF